MKKYLFIHLILALVCLLSAQYYGKNKIQAEKIHWNKMQTMHFDIYYPSDDESFGKIAALVSEEAYYFLREDFRTPINHRIPIIFYSSHQDFEATNVIPNLLSEGVGGFTESLHNRVVMPFSGSYREMESTLIHELTHAYVNEISNGQNNVLRPHQIPFWLSEGLPEFFSINGKSVYNNMFILDLIFNNNLVNLKEVGGYYAYREGESFLKFIEDEYGREMVMKIFYAARINDHDTFSKKLFDCSFMDLQLRWENHLKRKYFPIYNSYDVPYQAYEKITDARKDGSSMNSAPRFAPDGISFTWFSNKELTTDIYLADRLDLNKTSRLYRSGVKGNVEEFHYKKNNVSWFPDSTSFAFAANTSFGDFIHIYNLDKQNITQSIKFDSIKVIHEIDVSPDGSKIAFSGIKDTFTDIFIYDLNSHNIERLINDRYCDSAPRWSPDGTKIAFNSERIPLVHIQKKHVFDNCVNNIYYYDLTSKQFFQVTFNNSDSYKPVWDSSSSKILYVSDEDVITNIKAVDLINGSQAQVTSVISGVLDFDLAPSDENLLFSCFNNRSWNVYLAANPLNNLKWNEYFFPRKIDLEDDFWQSFNIDRINLYGKTKLAFKKPKPDQKKIDPDLAKKYDIKIDYGPDTTFVEYNRKIDRKPTMPNEPKAQPYKTKMKLDYLWGGLAYSSSGTYAMLDIVSSDILGNHSVYSSMEISGSIENSSFLMQYLNLERRNDFGGGGFYQNDDTIYQIYEDGIALDEYFRKRIRQYGIFGAFIHPFNKFWRAQLQLAFIKQQIFWDKWDDQDGVWLDDGFDLISGMEESQSSIIAPEIGFVHDNTLYGSVGPISGWKAYWKIEHGFSTRKPYTFTYTDMRKYFFFAQRYAWANRLLAGWIHGDDIAEFDLTGFYGVRGFDDDDVNGAKKLLLSTEFRFPMIDRLALGFPFPVTIDGVRGSAFIDIGAVWDNNKDFVFQDNGILKTPKMGFGFGPRLNMGYFVLKFDIAWSSDLSQTSKPKYYLWLIENF